jgi:hypothetical protein
MTYGPAEVQVRVVGSDLDGIDFTTKLVPQTRLRCRECNITLTLPMLQARAVAVAHNKERHPHTTVLNLDHEPLEPYEVIQ